MRRPNAADRRAADEHKRHVLAHLATMTPEEKQARSDAALARFEARGSVLRPFLVGETADPCTVAPVCMFGDCFPREVRAVFKYPLSDVDRERIARLLAEAVAHDYAAVKTDNGKRVAVKLIRNVPKVPA